MLEGLYLRLPIGPKLRGAVETDLTDIESSWEQLIKQRQLVLSFMGELWMQTQTGARGNLTMPHSIASIRLKSETTQGNRVPS